MRARGGGVLSASALVAGGTSLLLAALVGLGISELGTGDSGSPATTMRSEAASVVVPGTDSKPAKPAPAATHAHRPSTPQVAPTYTWTAPVVQSSRAPSTTGGSTSASTLATKSTSSTPSPSASPTPTHGNGKAKGAGNGQHKPSKH